MEYPEDVQSAILHIKNELSRSRLSKVIVLQKYWQTPPKTLSRHTAAGNDAHETNTIQLYKMHSCGNQKSYPNHRTTIQLIAINAMHHYL